MKNLLMPRRDVIVAGAAAVGSAACGPYDEVRRVMPGRSPGLGPNPIAARGAPIALATTVTGLAVGAGASMNVGQLNPGFRFGYWIDEIRFITSLQGLTATAGNPTAVQYEFMGVPGTVRFKIGTGRSAFSKVAVPQWNFAPTFAKSELAQTWITGALPDGTVPNTMTQTWITRWVLPKPLFMLPGDALQIYVERDSVFGATFLGNSMNVTVGFTGRAHAPGQPMPGEQYVPHVGYYKFTVDGATKIACATSDEFANPFANKPWNIQRYIHRGIGDQSRGAAVNWLPSTFATTSTVRMYDSLDYAIIPHETPIDLVTPHDQWVAVSTYDKTMGPCSWTFNRSLAKRAQINAAYVTSWLGYTTQLQASFVGFREEGI